MGDLPVIVALPVRDLTAGGAGSISNPAHARDKIRAVRIEQIMRAAENAVQAVEIFLERRLTAALQNVARALQLHLVEAVINRIDLLRLDLFGDGSKRNERKRQNAHHREQHPDIQRVPEQDFRLRR